MRTVFAADGGNSKTDVALVAEDGSVLGYARGPQASPDQIGVEGSLDVLANLAERVGAPADLAALLLAGIDFPDEEDVYRAAAEKRGFAERTMVGNDTFAVLRAGTGEGWGVAVTCGAGINCVGVARDGRRLRFASLGAWSGDWGGGRDVGLAALVAAARSEDGRGPATSLEQVVPAHFGLGTPTDLSRALLAGRVTDRELGTLAPVVLAESERDGEAAAIVERLAEEVATMATTALRRLELLGDDVPVVLGGGMLQSGNVRLIGAIAERLAAVGATPRLLSSPPIVGSVLLALDELGAAPEAHERVREELDAAVRDTDRT